MDKQQILALIFELADAILDDLRREEIDINRKCLESGLATLISLVKKINEEDAKQ